MDRIIYSFFTAFVCFLLGAFVYSRDTRKNVNRFFFLFNLSLFVWNSSDFVGPFIANFKTILVQYYRLTYLGGILLIPSFINLIFSISPPKRIFTGEKIFTNILYCVAAILSLLLPTSLIIQDVAFNLTYQEVSGPLYSFFALYFLVGFVYALVRLQRGY